MKLFLLMLLCVVITNEISAQGVTKNGESTNASTTFVSRNSKIGSGLVLDRNGKVYVLASIFPTTSPPICFTASPAILTATGDGGTGLYTYQWYKNSAVIPGATNSIYSPANINITSSNGYYCAITSGSYGTAITSTTAINIKAQATITAGGGGSYTVGTDVTLTSGGSNIINQYWQGPNGFYTVEKDPVLNNITFAMAGTYIVTGNSLSGINMVTNGDFESGNIGFTSDYNLAAQIANGLQPEGAYDVIVSPQSRHGSFEPCADHTSGIGKQMVVNGSPIPDAEIWTQTVNVVPGTDYQFTYWVQSVYNSNPSRMQLWVNDNPIGLPYIAIPETCQWKQFNYNWNSGLSTTAKLSLTNQNIIKDGNDFALDDIVFKQVCNTTSSVVVTVQ